MARLRTTQIYFHTVWGGQKSETVLMVSTGWLASAALGEDLLSLCSEFSRPLPSLDPGSFLLQSKPQGVKPSSPCLPLALSLLPQASTSEDAGDSFGATQTILEDLLVNKVSSLHCLNSLVFSGPGD